MWGQEIAFLQDYEADCEGTEDITGASCVKGEDGIIVADSDGVKEVWGGEYM